MALPRFNSGRFGKLTHTVINEAFGLIEANRVQPGQGRGEDRGRPSVVQEARWFARITDRSTTTPIKYSGQEVYRNGDSFDLLVNGRVMDKTGDVAANIYGLNIWEGGGASPIPNGTVVEVREYHRATSGLGRDIVGGGFPAESVFDALITGSQVLGTNKWRYSWKAAIISGTSFIVDTAGRTSTVSGNDFALPALNGCETLITNTGGTITGTTATAQLLPIPVGICVHIRESVEFGGGGGKKYSFSLPNAYAVACGAPSR